MVESRCSINLDKVNGSSIGMGASPNTFLHKTHYWINQKVYVIMAAFWMV